MDFYDSLEVRPPGDREADLFCMLEKQFQNAREHSRYFSRLYKDCAVPRDRDQLASLPVTRKSDLIELQRTDGRFGGVLAIGATSLGRIYQSPGPIYDPEGRRENYWRIARAVHAAGFRAGELAHNCFSYHLTPGGLMFESGAHALGCCVFPGGVGNTELQARAVADLRPAGYLGTPSFLKAIIGKGLELGLDLSSLRRALVSGEPLPDVLRREFLGFGVEVRQAYATADLGLIAYETVAGEGLVIDEEVIVEVVRPGSGEPVTDGAVGEVVVTTLTPEYPLIRYATGDLSAVLAGESSCGRTNARLKGWLGRVDQSTKVRGMFVHPAQVGEVVARHPPVTRARLEIENGPSGDVMTMVCEVAELVRSEALSYEIAATLRSVTKLRGAVQFVAPGEFSNGGKVIVDRRTNQE